MEFFYEISDPEAAKREFEVNINEFYWGGQHVKATLVVAPVVEENCP